MSEYQYYEFAAIDRPLSEKEMDELGKLSSRAEITPTSFTVAYNYGDFRGNPKKMMQKYFDFFIYLANWGSYHMMIRVPNWALDRRQLKPYLDGEVVALHEASDNLIVEFNANEEEPPAEWVEGEGWLQSLLPVRDSLMAGDLRPFYLGWLRAAWQGVVEDDDVEPPVPPGLGKLSGSLKSFAEFLAIDVDLIAAAARGNETADAPTGPSHDDFAAWVAGLDDVRKNAWLLELMEGEGSKTRLEVLRAFHTEPGRSTKCADARTNPGRTAAQLIAATEPIREERLSRERRKKEKAKLDGRKKHLDELAGREAAAWREVDTLLSTTASKKHATAVTLLADLRDVAARRGRIDEAQQRIDQYRQRFARRHSIMRRFRDAGL
jgi:hypothetical protein